MLRSIYLTQLFGVRLGSTDETATVLFSKTQRVQYLRAIFFFSETVLLIILATTLNAETDSVSALIRCLLIYLPKCINWK